MPRVFVLEPPRSTVDLSSTEKFGEVTFIFQPGDRRCSVFLGNEYGEIVLEKLREMNFDPIKGDSFCITGGMIPVSIAVAAIIVTYGGIRVLFWSAAECRYVERWVGSWKRKGDANDGNSRRNCGKKDQQINETVSSTAERDGNCS